MLGICCEWNWQIEKRRREPPLPIMLLSLLLFGSVLSLSRPWGKSSAITDQDLYSLGCSTVDYKGVKTCFLPVLFCTEWRDAFFCLLPWLKYPITDFWSSCSKIFRSIWFAVCTTLLPAYFVRWLFFSTRHNRAEPKRCPESTSIFIHKEWRGKAVDKSVSFLKHRCSHLLSYFEIQQQT